mmetsp:Transcript_64242/g.199303  ORF Transcript_64242/g.199303 Transcript_64242/m.199303 type:complete len:294 (+) Transcript_64242:114-995(+)
MSSSPCAFAAEGVPWDRSGPTTWARSAPVAEHHPSVASIWEPPWLSVDEGKVTKHCRGRSTSPTSKGDSSGGSACPDLSAPSITDYGRTPSPSPEPRHHPLALPAVLEADMMDMMAFDKAVVPPPPPAPFVPKGKAACSHGVAIANMQDDVPTGDAACGLGAAVADVQEDDVPVPSVGSAGHPFCCGFPCKYARKPRGCKEGKSCERCHLCHFTRARQRDSKREAKKQAAGQLEAGRAGGAEAAAPEAGGGPMLVQAFGGMQAGFSMATVWEVAPELLCNTDIWVPYSWVTEQ